MNYQQLFVLGAVIAYSHGAFAQGECSQYTVRYDITYCYSKLFVESDKELNEVYKSLRGILSEDSKRALTAVQRDWIMYRDHACQEKPGTINVDCNYAVNRARTEYLRDRLRECKSGTCRSELIGRSSWD